MKKYLSRIIKEEIRQSMNHNFLTILSESFNTSIRGKPKIKLLFLFSVSLFLWGVWELIHKNACSYEYVIPLCNQSFQKLNFSLIGILHVQYDFPNIIGVSIALKEVCTFICYCNHSSLKASHLQFTA